MRKLSIILAFYAAGLLVSLPAKAATYNIRDFDSQCGQSNYNCRSAFQKAFASIAQHGGGTLSLPAGTFLIDYPEYANARTTPPPVLAVPANTIIQGHLTADGTPDSIIAWRTVGWPALVFAKSSGSGLQNIHAQFIGVTPKSMNSWPAGVGDTTLLRALGHVASFPHNNQLGGGAYELFAFAYVLDSDNCVFNNLIFDSASHDNNHVYGFGIVLKGKDVIETNGGGMWHLASSNKITNTKFYDVLMGMLVSGQKDLVIRNIYSDRRGSSSAVAPGHVLYLTGQPQYAPGKTTYLSNQNILVDGITEGPDAYDLSTALGTFAVKSVDGGTIRNVKSAQPAGLFQTIQGVSNVTFSSINWESDAKFCDTTPPPSLCNVAIINITPSQPGQVQNLKMTFKDISLKSKNRPISVSFSGDDLVVDGLYIETPPDFLPGQANASAVVGLHHTQGANIKNYTYVPLVTVHDPHGKYNIPLEAWNSAANVIGAVTIKWPASVEKPDNNEHIVHPDAQDKTVTNSLKAQVVTR